MTEDDRQEYVKRLKWTDSEPIYASLYYRPYDVCKTYDFSKVQFSKNTQADETDEIKVISFLIFKQ